MVCNRKNKFMLDRKLLTIKTSLVGHHFVDKSFNIAVQYGSRCLLLDERGNCDAAHSHKDVQVKQVVIHPMFLYDYCYSGDIALLELEHPIEFSNSHDRKLRPNETSVADFGCLPTANFEVEGEISLAGFGIDPRNEDHPDLKDEYYEKWLKYINVTVADSCLGFMDKETYQPIDGLCTQSTEGVPCQGDSAGPLVLPRSAKKDTIVAVHSASLKCERSKDFIETNEDERLLLRLNKHTDLRYHLRWICTLTGVCTEEYDEEYLIEKPVVLF